MFIKFGDKTKKLEVKNGKKKQDDSKDCVYIDDDEDRRSKILKEVLKK